MNIKTILIYLITFALSITFTTIAEKIIKGPVNNFDICDLKIGNKTLFLNKKGCLKKHYIKECTIIFWIISIVAILIPCLLAGLRDPYVGLDTKFYVVSNFNKVVRNEPDFFDFVFDSELKIQVVSIEPAFAVLVYFCAKVFNNLQVLLFLISLLTIAPIYLALYINRNNNSIALGMGIFLFFFYSFTLSGMRQSIAMAFVVLAYSEFYNKKYILSLISCVIAYFFHTSTIIIIPILMILYIITKLKNKKKVYSLLFIFLAIFFVFYRNIALVISEFLSFISERYAGYIRRYLYPAFMWSDIPITDFLSKTLIVVILVLLICKYKKSSMMESSLIAVILGRYFVLFQANFFESMRIAIYFDYFMIFIIPMVVKRRFSDNLDTKIVTYIIALMPAMAYWFYFMMYIGAYRTNEFIFYFE